MRHAAARLATHGGDGAAAQQGQASSLALLAVQTDASVRPEHWQY